MTVDVKHFEGKFFVWRKFVNSNRLRKPFTKQQGIGPTFQHDSFESAETEARRLAELFPESTFIVMQELARVKVIEENNNNL